MDMDWVSEIGILRPDDITAFLLVPASSTLKNPHKWQKMKKSLHCGMRDESWTFLSTFLENLPIEVLFNADFDGMVQIVDFRQALLYKNYNLSF